MELILKEKMNLKKLFLKNCKNKELEINDNQIKIIELINKFYQDNFNKSFFLNLFYPKKIKKEFY